MRKIIRIMGLLAFGLSAGTALADFSLCPEGYVCLFGDSNYQGRFVGYPGAARVDNVGDYINDLTTSIWNRTDTMMCFFEHDNYGGQAYAIPAGGSSPNIGNRFNDRITSIRPC